MKKTRDTFIFIWALVLIFFNIVCFVSPNIVSANGTEYDKFGGAFWAGYILITGAFLGMLVSICYAFRSDSLQKLFYNIPFIRIGYIGLIVMLIVGGLTMAIPNFPMWLGIIICVLVLIVTDIALANAETAAELVGDIDVKVAEKTKFIKLLTADAEGLVANAKSDSVKAACKKVYEAIRYSDPMSSDELNLVEAQITVKMSELASAVVADDGEKVCELAENMLTLVGDRNRKCRVLK